MRRAALLTLMGVILIPCLQEGFPNAVLEGMAAAKPVVASRAGGVPEAVVHGEAGLLVPPEDPRALSDAILDLLNQPDRAVTMGHAARRRVEEHFSLPAIVTRHEGLYDELAGGLRG